MPSGSRFKVASKREQNKFIYYVEREQLRRSQDDKVGLKGKLFWVYYTLISSTPAKAVFRFPFSHFSFSKAYIPRTCSIRL